MSDINSSRVPLVLLLFPLIPYTGDEVNNTLNRGDGWAHYPFNDVPIVLTRCVSAFAEHLVSQFALTIWHTKVSPSQFLTLIQDSRTDLD